jgi:two-component system, NtrC family, nitrogen regulation response regulator NtrX
VSEDIDQPRRRILVVDDEKNIRRMLRMILEGEGYHVEDFESAELLLERLGHGPADAILLDVRLPGIDGISALEKIRVAHPESNVIMISGHANLNDAVRATKLGAFDFLEKPLDRERILVSVRNSVERRALTSRIDALEFAEGGEEPMLGESKQMERIRAQILKIAPTSVRVLITGESGTGKELVARGVHRASNRQEGPFVKVNCAAIPSELIESELFGHERGAFTGAVQRKRGCFELADGGTLFLDEIGDMSLDAQAKVLRAIQTGEICRVGGEQTFTVDVRFVAATNKDLEELVRNGLFREDLYYRLSVVPIQTTPLRQRDGDILRLMNSFLARFAAEHASGVLTLSKEAEAVVRDYSFPGNVRELRNLAERLVILAEDPITIEDLPPTVLGAQSVSRSSEGIASDTSHLIDLNTYKNLTLRELRETVERSYILKKLEETGWNVTRSAEMLGIERTNLHKKLKQLGIKKGE